MHKKLHLSKLCNLFNPDLMEELFKNGITLVTTISPIVAHARGYSELLSLIAGRTVSSHGQSKSFRALFA